MPVMGLEGQSRRAAAAVAGMSFLGGGEGQEQPWGWKARLLLLPEETEGTQDQGAKGSPGFGQARSWRVSGGNAAPPAKGNFAA